MTLIIQKPTTSKLILAKDYIPVDPDYNSVSLLLHGDGTNGSTTITDSSLSPKTVTAFGNAQISTAQSKFGGASIAFDGSGDYISAGSNAAFQFGTGSFSIEMWARFTAISDQLLYDTIPIGAVSTRLNGFAFVLQATGKLNVFSVNTAGGTPSGFKLASTTTITSNSWHHIALTRNGDAWTYFLNGNADGTFIFPQNISDSTFLFGRVGDTPSYYVNGYIDDFRITKGVARYTANFTPPTAPFPDIASR